MLAEPPEAPRAEWGSEGTDLWVVYNEGLYNERDDGPGPRRPLSAGRAVMVKYSHAFVR